MNILISNSTDVFGGGENYVFILARCLHERGHEVWVSALPDHLLLQKCAAHGIATIPIAYKGMHRVFNVAAALREELKKHSIDIIHSNANYDRTCAAIAAGFSRVRHVAAIHSSHSIQHNLTHWLRNRYGIDHFIAVAENVRNVLVAEDRIPAAKITVIPNGVLNDSESSIARKQSRALLEVGEKTIVIGNVGSLTPLKGHAFLLRTIAEVVNVYPHVLCPIFGKGELWDELHELARSLQIEQFVRFMGFRNDVDAFYHAFDIYCHASRGSVPDAFPLAILQALAASLPVVATRMGDIPTMVEHGVSGYLTTPEDSHAMAEALVAMIRDPPLRHSMGSASFEIFRKRFHASLMTENVERVYSKVLGQP